MSREEDNKKKVAPSYNAGDIMSPQEMIEMCAHEPKAQYLWRGIEDASFGYVFGPSKTGKTIFCENLGMALAVGRETFFGDELIGKPQRVVMVGIEENHRKRAERMQKQMQDLTPTEQKLLNENMLYVGKDFPQTLDNEEYWKQFENKIEELDPDIIFIDSLTRMINEDITDRKVCQKILKKLRSFAYEKGIALVMVHHTRKNNGNAITMETMIGSSILSQEADFAIGLNRNELTGERYVKDIFYRYKEVNEKVKTYSINGENCWLNPIGEEEEYRVVNGSKEKTIDSKELILDFFKQRAEEENLNSITIKKKELKKHFVDSGIFKSRTFDYHLEVLIKKHKLEKGMIQGDYIFNVEK